MRLFHILSSFGIPAAACHLIFLPSVGSSIFHGEFTQSSSHMSIKENTHKMSPEMTSNVALHGILLWASMGFLMPLGILAIRMSNRLQDRRKAKVFFYLHVLFQMLSVILSTIGAIMSIRNFENLFNNNHQRLGLVLYAATFVQALTGFVRPSRGNRCRRTWFSVHWLFGTTISVMGIVNIYTGLKAYHSKTSKRATIWTVIFTAQICFMALFYLFQDKWEYIRRQGVINLDNHNNSLDRAHHQPATSADAIQVVTATDRDNEKVLVLEPCGRRNALMNLFE